MILAMDVLRWLTVRALVGQTWAGANVLDSPSQPADLRILEDQAPFIAVYTDDADLTLDGNSIADGRAEVYLVIEVAVGESVERTPPANENDPEPLPVRMGETDRGREATIGYIARQVNQALTATGNPWAELWRVLAPVRSKVEVRRGGAGQEQVPAVRFASRIMRYTVEVLSDPVLGEPVPEGFWADFLTAASADPDLADTARLVRAEIAGGGALPSWRIAQKQLTLTNEGVRSLGIAPVVISDETEAPTFTDIIFDQQDGAALDEAAENDAGGDGATEGLVRP